MAQDLGREELAVPVRHARRRQQAREGRGLPAAAGSRPSARGRGYPINPSGSSFS